MGSDNYWTRAVRRRASRRGVLGAAGVTAIGGAGLLAVGCGDDDDDDDGGSNPTETSSGGDASPSAGGGDPKPGGTHNTSSANFPPTMNPYVTQDSPNKTVTNSVYSNLWQVKGVALGPDFPSQEIVPDLAKSTEFPDDLTVTATLNELARWTDPIGRPVVAEDIVFAFDRFLGADGGTPSVVSSQLSMLDSYEAVDEQTIKFTLKSPNVLFQWRAADNYTIPIMPPESDGDFDPDQTAVGSGPFILESVNAPTNWTLARNPEWHLGPDRPYLDKIEETVIQDPATGLNQFKAGNIDTSQLVPTQIAEVLDAIPDVVTYGVLSPFFTFIAFSDKDPNSPWNTDVRVRHALSMSIDRDALFEAMFSPGDIEAAGLPRPKTEWHGAVPAGLGPSWLNPQGDRITPEAAETFVYNPEKARALLEEAGFGDGFSAEYHYATIYGANHTLQAELVQQMVAEAGINLDIKIDDNTSVYQPKTFRGDFEGTAHILQGFTNPLDYYVAMYDPASSRNQGHVDDDFINTEVAALLGDFDVESRNERSLELQQYMLDQMYYVPTMLFSGPNYSARHPYLKGGLDKFTARSSGPFNQRPELWLDKA